MKKKRCASAVGCGPSLYCNNESICYIFYLFSLIFSDLKIWVSSLNHVRRAAFVRLGAPYRYLQVARSDRAFDLSVFRKSVVLNGLQCKYEWVKDAFRK